MRYSVVCGIPISFEALPRKAKARKKQARKKRDCTRKNTKLLKFSLELHTFQMCMKQQPTPTTAMKRRYIKLF